MGALTYHPPTHRSSTDNTLLDLHALASLSQQIFAGEGRAPAYHHFVELAKQYDIPTKEVKSMIAEIADSKERWPEFAEAAGVSEAGTNDISKYF
ncbi:MAG: hypothetical protein KAI39_12610 [Desulfobulbaceae bacterium]|nr:hypothetical protein [Desulfobulbaceae bacterium]